MKAPKNWRNTGYLIPENINPDDNICICVPVPKDWGHARAFLGQITELSKWQAWQADGTTNARDTARRWFDIAACVAEEIDCAMANKGCGCSDNPDRLFRHNPTTDRLEQSDDGGETWQDAPDPRYDSPLFPPQQGTDEADTKCLSATNAMLYFKDQLIGQASEWTTLTTVIAGILTVVIGVLTGGLGAALVITLAAAFIEAGVGTAVAAFTTEVYDRFKCNLYCHASSDGSWDEAALASIKAQIDVDETGVANTILKGWIDQLGTAGLTNSGRVTVENDADCSGCDCVPPCQSADSFYWGTVNSVTDNLDGTFTFNVTSAPSPGDGTEFIGWGDRDNAGSPCCTFVSQSAFEGTALGGAYQSCGVSDEIPDPPAPDYCIHFYIIYGNLALTTPFTCDIVMGALCP